MEKAEVLNFGKPFEVRQFPKGHLELLKIGGTTVGRGFFEPWVVGNETVIVVDFQGLIDYAKAP